MKTFKLDIHRHFYYDYEVKANNKEEAESKALAASLLQVETNDIKLLESGCYDQEAFDCKEVTK